jgi:hypothetical protein
MHVRFGVARSNSRESGPRNVGGGVYNSLDVDVSLSVGVSLSVDVSTSFGDSLKGVDLVSIDPLSIVVYTWAK